MAASAEQGGGTLEPGSARRISIDPCSGAENLATTVADMSGAADHWRSLEEAAKKRWGPVNLLTTAFEASTELETELRQWAAKHKSLPSEKPWLRHSLDDPFLDGIHEISERRRILALGVVSFANSVEVVAQRLPGGIPASLRAFVDKMLAATKEARKVFYEETIRDRDGEEAMRNYRDEEAMRDYHDETRLQYHARGYQVCLSTLDGERRVCGHRQRTRRHLLRGHGRHFDRHYLRPVDVSDSFGRATDAKSLAPYLRASGSSECFRSNCSTERSRGHSGSPIHSVPTDHPRPACPRRGSTVRG